MTERSASVFLGADAVRELDEIAEQRALRLARTARMPRPSYISAAYDDRRSNETPLSNGFQTVLGGLFGIAVFVGLLYLGVKLIEYVSSRGTDPATVIAPGPTTEAPNCTMVKPYAGEPGYIWSDGNCHHLPRNYE